MSIEQIPYEQPCTSEQLDNIRKQIARHKARANEREQRLRDESTWRSICNYTDNGVAAS